MSANSWVRFEGCIGKMLKLLQKLVGDPHKRTIEKIQPLVVQINSLEDSIKPLSDDDLRSKTYEFRQKIDNATRDITDKDKKYQKEQELLADLLPEAFAVVREASWRVLGQRHFDVQLIGGIVLHRGQISEMKTGEGKTLVSTSPTYLNALAGRGVHVVTVNDYLAGRDSEWMGQIHRFLGLKVGAILHHLTPHERRKVYAGDVIYGTNNEFGFDYLRDNMSTEIDQCVQRELHYAVIDEVDSILIDEARTPLIISGTLAQPAETYQQFNKIVGRLEGKAKDYNKKKKLLDEIDYEEDEKDCDYVIDDKQKNIILTERGILKAQKVLNIPDLFSAEHPEYAHHLIIALKSKELYRRDVEYVVRPNERGEMEVVIVDEFTGRLMFGRRYSDGLHQAIEAKEGVKIQDETQTLATITLQNYFRLYRKLGGMTGTAITEEAEFGKIYNLPVVVIPTNRPIARKDQPDIIYKNIQAKFHAVADEIEVMHAAGRPVLVGTVSIEKSEQIGDILKRRGVPHNVLNAKNHEKEAEIIAQAGRKGGVTIATNMAGRGTDILLGGNAEFLLLRKLRMEGEDPETVDPALKAKMLKEIEAQIAAERDVVREAGGLHVMGTERHESRRIDNQLRGRAGRQGDPGSSKFFLSLEDDLMRMFGGDRVSKVMDMLKVEENEPIESGMVTKAIENAQKKVEMYHFGVRKSILEYDEVMNSQRTIIYQQRRKILEGDSLRPVVEDMIIRNMEDMLGRYVQQGVPQEEWDLAGLHQDLSHHIPLLGSIHLDELRIPIEGLQVFVKDQALNAYEAKEMILGEELMRDLERMVILRVIDQKWIDHLHEMDALREGIGLRAYGQKDPLIEYKKEARTIFQEMMSNIRFEVVTTLFHIQVEYQMPMMPDMMDMAVDYQEIGPEGDLPDQALMGEMSNLIPGIMGMGALGLSDGISFDASNLNSDGGELV
jgi:preprotein translocase subunit SecA